MRNYGSSWLFSLACLAMHMGCAHARGSGPSDTAAPPFELASPTAKEKKAFQLALLRANDAMRQGKFSTAKYFLERQNPTEKTAQVYKAVLLAKAHMGMGEHGVADSVLAACLAWISGSGWRNYLTSLRLESFPRAQVPDSARLEYYEALRETRLDAEVRYHAILEILRLRGFKGSPAGFEDLLEQLLRLGHSDARLDSLYDLVSGHVPPGRKPWRWQELLLDWEEKKGRYERAIERSRAMLRIVPGIEEKKELHLNFAGLYYKNRDYRQAVRYYRLYLKRYGAHEEAMLQIARAYDKLRESKKSLDWYERFLEAFPDHDKTSEIYWLRGWEAEAAGKYDEAVEYYLRQLSGFRGNRRGDWANFRIGYCYYKSGNYPNALQFFRDIRGRKGSRSADAGLYWEGRAAEMVDDSAAARRAYVEAYENFHFRFYGHFARERMERLGWWHDSLERVVDFGAAHKGDVKAWMRENLPAFDERLDRSFESEYVGVGRLLHFNLDTLALLTLETFPGRITSNPWFLYVNAGLLAKHGLWSEAYRMALRLNYQIPTEAMGKVPRKVLKLIYPKPFPDLVQRQAVRQGVDPDFVYALMRQESAFDAGIRSWAGAVGLMQIMPATGDMLARQEELAEFNRYMLTDPAVNVRLGVSYLSGLKRRYRDNYFFVLANYNAGPGPAQRWQKLHGDKPLHLMIEEISYWETRDYLKKVMGNYWTYKSIWGRG